NNIQNSTAEIIGHDLGWPVAKTKEGLDRAGLGLDNRCLRKSLQIRIAGNVVTMSVRMGHDQGNVCAAVLDEPMVDLPLNHLGYIRLSRAGIEQKCLVLSKEQEQKGLFVVRTS